MAVAVGGKLIAVDLFDSPLTCQKVWPRLVAGASLDALEEASAKEVSESEVVEAIQSLSVAPWQSVPPAGAGEEQRAEIPAKWHGSVLTLGGNLVHGSLVAAS